MLIVGLAAIWLLPRLAYGRAESEKLDAERSMFSPCPVSAYTRGAADTVEEAYLASRSGFDSMGRPVDPDAMKKLAEEET